MLLGSGGLHSPAGSEALSLQPFLRDTGDLVYI